ncbi:MAG: PepSY-like domain-containing protein [Bacteroidia bacterium]|nr:PepSY-like domain-containing protein [Bacteroidia bacterium]MCZ2248280.1 PepSY-like domain-containing protein [Bacteroidia bacterium]
MKKIIAIATVVFSILITTSCDKEALLTKDKIPSEIKTYVQTHFSTTSISRAVKDKDGKELYEVLLANGVKLEFNKQIEIIDIDWNSKLPDSVIPANILSYVNSNYSSNYIVGWELKYGNQEVQLNNSLALIFNISGTFLRDDD